MTRHSLLVTRHFHYGVDIADTLLAVDAARAGDTVCSLDRDFEKLPVAWEPPPPVWVQGLDPRRRRSVSLRTLSGQDLEGDWRDDPTLCPHCGRASWPVPQNITLISHVQEAVWPHVKAWTDRFKGFRFCPHLGCPVVYFHRDIPLVVGTSEVRTRVGYKVDTDPIPVCYCIGVLAETIREEIVVKLLRFSRRHPAVYGGPHGQVVSYHESVGAVLRADGPAGHRGGPPGAGRGESGRAGPSAG